jgi:hypothetical protein
MSRLPACLAVCCLAAGLLASDGGVTVSAAPLPAEWREHARRLAADEFADRQAAERNLTATPNVAALPWLAEIARGSDDEAALRAVRVLERWMVSAPLELADQAETQLALLRAEAAAGSVRSAADALTVQRQLRQKRAVAVLRELGAKVDLGPDREALEIAYNVQHDFVIGYDREVYVEGQIGAAAPPDVDDPVVVDDELNDSNDPFGENERIARDEIPQLPRQIWLTPKWTGGDEGARQLRRLENVGVMAVYVVKGCGTSLEAVQLATAEIDEINVLSRGPSLGVAGATGPEDCVIERVLAGGAAEQAGLEGGDVVVQVGEQPITAFHELITEVAKHNSGESVKIRVQRGFETLTKEVTLGDWTEVETESQLWRPDGGAIWRARPMFFPMGPIQPKFMPPAPEPK